jgi:hypothetical protein
VNVRGAEVVDPADPGSSLEIGWYLPPEEGPEDARPVELSGVTVLPSALSRSGAEPGHVWHFRVDGRGPFTETMYFDSGFLPPFRPSDVTLGLTDISAYGYQTMLLTELRYCSRAPIFTDGDWGIPQTIVQGFLED